MARPAFKAVDAVLIRAAAYPDGLSLPPWPDLTTDDSAALLAWLRQVWSVDGVARAIGVASPDLARALTGLHDGTAPAQPQRVRRAVEALIRYLLRWTSRPTPFGLFAGIAVAGLSGHASVRWGERHTVSERADAAWFADLISDLEAQLPVLRGLPVQTNNLGFRRGTEWIVPCQPTTKGGFADVAVTLSLPVERVLGATRAPITFAALLARMREEYPTVPIETIEGMLTELVAFGVLLTGLRPPMTVTNPISHLASAITGSSVPAPLLDFGPPRAVDLRLDCAVALPPAVVRTAQDAASLLAALGPQRSVWRTYHAAFLERFGPGAVVSVREVADPDRGIGYPAGYRGTAMETPQRLSRRDLLLARLAQAAALEGRTEVTLEENLLQELSPGASMATATAPHTELRFMLDASTPAALDSGDFTMRVVSASRQAGTTAGRFLYLLEPDERDHFSKAYQDLPTSTAGAVTVQLSCPPLVARTGHLARVPAVLPVLALGEHRSSADTAFDLDELAVTADAHRFYLVSTRTGQIIEPVLPNAVDLRYATQPMARLLCEISTGLSMPCRPFSWGQAAEEFTFLPRLRHGRIILSSARWTISGDQLPAPGAPAGEWCAAFTALRTVRRVPDHVLVGDDDVVIRIDLTEPAHLAILRGQLRKTTTLTMTEAEHDFGWIGGRPHEIVMPLAATAATVAARSAIRPIRRRLTAAGPRHLPGASWWLYAQLFGHPSRQNDLLAVHLPDLLSGWVDGPSDDWWFIRYCEPEPHLRVRFRLHHPDRYGPAAAAFAEWAAALHETGVLRDLALTTYRPETGRFGHGEALRAAETLFAADSAYAVAHLHADIDPAAATAAGHLGLAIGLLGTDGTGWLIDHLNHGGVPALDRAVLAQAHHLHHCAPADLAGPTIRRRRALAAYRSHLDDRDIDAALTDLLHLHHTRMIGIEPDSERMCLRLARALAQQSRHEERSRTWSSPSKHAVPRTE